MKDGLRAGDIIGSIRAIFRKGDEQRAPLDVTELVREVLTLMQGEIETGRVSVQTELTSELPKVLGHRIQLQLVFRNLILNAVESDEFRYRLGTGVAYKIRGYAVRRADCSGRFWNGHSPGYHGP